MLIYCLTPAQTSNFKLFKPSLPPLAEARDTRLRLLLLLRLSCRRFPCRAALQHASRWEAGRNSGRHTAPCARRCQALAQGIEARGKVQCAGVRRRRVARGCSMLREGGHSCTRRLPLHHLPRECGRARVAGHFPWRLRLRVRLRGCRGGRRLLRCALPCRSAGPAQEEPRPEAALATALPSCASAAISAGPTGRSSFAAGGCGFVQGLRGRLGRRCCHLLLLLLLQQLQLLHSVAQRSAAQHSSW